MNANELLAQQYDSQYRTRLTCTVNTALQHDRLLPKCRFVPRPDFVKDTTVCRCLVACQVMNDFALPFFETKIS